MSWVKEFVYHPPLNGWDSGGPPYTCSANVSPTPSSSFSPQQPPWGVNWADREWLAFMAKAGDELTVFIALWKLCYIIALEQTSLFLYWFYVTKKKKNIEIFINLYSSFRFILGKVKQRYWSIDYLWTLGHWTPDQCKEMKVHTDIFLISATGFGPNNNIRL